MEIPYNPISTAPTDGTVILTDAGVVQYRLGRWLSCDMGGDYFCGDEGAFTANPKAWVPLPIWKLE